MSSFALLVCCLAFASAERHYLQRKISRIINGEEANPGEFPHQVTLLNGGYHMCGGSIIANGWAITAAHCVDGQTAGNLAVVVDLHDFSNPGNYIWFDIAEYIKHPNYDQGSGAFPNDVALLRLTANGDDITKNIITLASDPDNLFTDATCIVSGWGVTEGGSGASTLQKAEVTALSDSECKSYWGNSNILSQHLCVMGFPAPGTGSCNGDSGGPLVCSGLLAGVTSWGRSGCHVDGTVTHPSVYARVSSFYSWIKSNCNNCL